MYIICFSYQYICENNKINKIKVCFHLDRNQLREYMLPGGQYIHFKKLFRFNFEIIQN